MIINIEVLDKDKFFLIKYKDDGKGIELDNNNYVFEPFFKGNMGSKTLGMGLNEVYRIVKYIFKGEIIFNSEVNKGVEIEISIPKRIREEKHGY